MFGNQLEIRFTQERIDKVIEIIRTMLNLYDTDKEMYKQTRKTVKGYGQAIIDLRRLTIKGLIGEDLRNEFDSKILKANREDKVKRADNFWIGIYEENQRRARLENRIDDSTAKYLKLNEFETEYGKQITIGIPYTDNMMNHKQRFAYTMIVKQKTTPLFYGMASRLQTFKY